MRPSSAAPQLAFTLFLCLTCWPRGARADAPLTIDEAVRLALTNNERAQKAPLRVAAAVGQLDRARAAFLPTLVANASGSISGTPDRNGRILAGTGTISLNQPLLNIPAIPLYAQARRQLEAERWSATQDLRVLAFDTANAFLVVLTRERLLDAAKGKLERASADHQTAEARAAAQLASSNDVTRARIATAAAQRQVIGAQADVTQAYLELSFLVGRTISPPLAAPDRTTRAAQRGGLRGEEAVRAAEVRRPDVRAAHERTEALREGAKEPLYRLAPTISASAQLHLTADPIAPARVLDESGQITLTWTIYDAGTRYADRKTRVAQANSQALDEQLLKRSIATDIGIAVASLRAAREAYRISDEAAEATKKNTDETETLYQQGLARAIELTDANATRYDADVARETAKLAMEQAYLDLRFTLGLDAVDDTKDAAAPQGAKP